MLSREERLYCEDYEEKLAAEEDEADARRFVADMLEARAEGERCFIAKGSEQECTDYRPRTCDMLENRIRGIAGIAGTVVSYCYESYTFVWFGGPLELSDVYPVADGARGEWVGALAERRGFECPLARFGVTPSESRV